jgi:hypothetical protein
VLPCIISELNLIRGITESNLHKLYYIVNVGSWINEYPQAKSLIIDEFNLEGQNYLFEIAIHWEIGHGWEG